jgi:hypothetical protein
MPVHYRSLPTLSPEDIERFWSRVDKAPGHGPKGDCWVWDVGARFKTGYGKFMKRKVAYGAHRIGFMIATGTDPGKQCVCHECDFKPCIRGSHLFRGTHAANAADMKSKGRSATGDKNGMRTHPHRTSPGEKNGYAKLTDAQVREICRAYDANEMDQYELADKFGVWQMTISRIVRRVSRQTAHTCT